MVLDFTNGITYAAAGYLIFGAFMLAIPAAAGIGSFVYKRWTWKLAEYDESGQNRYYFEGRDKRGFRKPGMKEGIMSCLQLESFFLAYKAYHDVEAYEDLWITERVFNGAVEGLPSLLLQVYALLCKEQTGREISGKVLAINISSVLSSLKSVSDALGMLNFGVLSNIKLADIPSKGRLQAFQALDAWVRTSSLAAFSVCLRPAGLSLHQTTPNMIFIMLIEASFVLLAFKHFGRLTWQRLLSAGIMLQAVTAYCSLPLMVGNELSGPQLMKLQLVTVTWRHGDSVMLKVTG